VIPELPVVLDQPMTGPAHSRLPHAACPPDGGALGSLAPLLSPLTGTAALSNVRLMGD
jgi:hypothetical protein